jgi:peroxiredoxin Q/BCP
MRVLAKLTLAACLLAAGAFLARGAAADDKGGVKVGDKAPAFKGTDDQGKEWRLKNHVGKKVLVLYFYPADFTGGCTSQACGFRDNMAKLEDKGVEVVGVSGDSPKTHAQFKKDHDLPFTLLADEDGAIAKKFGIPVRKGGNIPRTTKGGKTFKVEQPVVILRWTVIIDRGGNVAAKYAVRSASQDAQQVLQTVGRLKAGQ